MRDGVVWRGWCGVMWRGWCEWHGVEGWCVWRGWYGGDGGVRMIAVGGWSTYSSLVCLFTC